MNDATPVEIDEADYEAVRAELDAANGYPMEVNGVVTLTTIPPAEELPRTEEGKVLFAFPSDVLKVIEKRAAVKDVLTVRAVELTRERYEEKLEVSQRSQGIIVDPDPEPPIKVPSGKTQ